MTILYDSAYQIDIDFIGHYSITDTATGKNIYLQGDDATQFHHELDTIEQSASDEQQQQMLINCLCSAYFA